MALNSLPEVYQSTWLEMRADLEMRYEVERDTGITTLFFGHRDDYVLVLGRDSLDRLVELGAAAREELTSAPPR